MTSLAIHAIPTQDIAAQLRHHCTQAPTLIKQHGQALASLGRALEWPNNSRAGLAECRDFNQIEADALDRSFQKEGQALVRNAQSIPRDTYSARLNQQAEALLDRYMKTDPDGAAAALAASKAHETRLIKEHGGAEDFMLTAARADQMFINLKNKNEVTTYWNDQIYTTHSVITKNYGPLIKAAQERLQSAQKDFDTHPNERTRSALNEYANELAETIDHRSHEWMKLQWFTQWRDESVASSSLFDKFLDGLKRLRDPQRR